MIRLLINNVPAIVEDGATILDAARSVHAHVPTLCSMSGLKPYGACRLCIVEIGSGDDVQIVSSCTFRAAEGLVVRTDTSRLRRARMLTVELMLASAPRSKTIQELAASLGIRSHRFRQEDENCILCGLCVRICSEKMRASAIGFSGRGDARAVGTPFDTPAEVCRLCGGCLYVCPTCQQHTPMLDTDQVTCVRCDATDMLLDELPGLR